MMVANAPSLAWLEKAQADDPVLRRVQAFDYENYPMPSIRVAPLEPLAPVSSVYSLR